MSRKQYGVNNKTIMKLVCKINKVIETFPVVPDNDNSITTTVIPPTGLLPGVPEQLEFINELNAKLRLVTRTRDRLRNI